MMVTRVTRLMAEYLRLVFERTLMISCSRQQRLNDDQRLLLLRMASISTRINTRQHDVTVITFTCSHQQS